MRWQRRDQHFDDQDMVRPWPPMTTMRGILTSEAGNGRGARAPLGTVVKYDYAESRLRRIKSGGICERLKR